MTRSSVTGKVNSLPVAMNVFSKTLRVCACLSPTPSLDILVILCLLLFLSLGPPWLKNTRIDRVYAPDNVGPTLLPTCNI